MKKIFIIGLLTINTVLLIPAMEIEKTEINEIESNQVLLDNQLMEAVEIGNIGIIKNLIDAGADIEAKEKSGYTPLHWAAAKGCKQVVLALLARDTDVSGKDKDAGPLDFS